ncbi:hypothetical protein C8R43DRAFT_1107674 [Mycena crocata]|nr:hypothetical protein C8R43DRAFT_1107674 [Mycena crocata]
MNLPRIASAHSPIDRLPVEILDLIFVKLPYNGIILPAQRGGRGGTPAVSFCHVCRLWSRIAQRHPFVWSNLRLYLDILTPQQVPRILEAIFRFISYAGRPVCLEIQQNNVNSLACDTVRRVLGHFSRSLLALKLCVPEETVEGLCALAFPFDRLRQLKILMRQSSTFAGQLGNPDAGADCYSLLASTPLLAELEVGYTVWLPTELLLITLDCWNPPLSQLTHFSCGTWMETSDCLIILTECPQLVMCMLCCEGDADAAEDPSTSTTVQHLRHLFLTFRVLHGHFWGHITTPKLERLGITTLSDDDEIAWDHPRFMAFKQRSGFSLVWLALRFDFSHQVDDMLDLLQNFPDLIDLRLRWTQLYEDALPDIARLLAYLAQPLHNSKLRQLWIDATPDSVRMLTTRCIDLRIPDQDERLTDIILYAQKPFDPETLFASEVQALRAAGMQLQFLPMDFFGAESLRDVYSFNDGDGSEQEDQADMTVDEHGTGSQTEGEDANLELEDE